MLQLLDLLLWILFLEIIDASCGLSDNIGYGYGLLVS